MEINIEFYGSKACANFFSPPPFFFSFYKLYKSFETKNLSSGMELKTIIEQIRGTISKILPILLFNQRREQPKM